MAQRSSQARINMVADDETSITLGLETSPDDIFKPLSHERRRAILCTLACEPTPIKLQTLSRAVATRQQTADMEPILAELIKQVHSSLYHTHLPKLADRGLVTFDPEAMTAGSVADTIKHGGA